MNKIVKPYLKIETNENHNSLVLVRKALSRSAKAITHTGKGNDQIRAIFESPDLYDVSCKLECVSDFNEMTFNEKRAVDSILKHNYDEWIKCINEYCLATK